MFAAGLATLLCPLNQLSLSPLTGLSSVTICLSPVPDIGYTPVYWAICFLHEASL